MAPPLVIHAPSLRRGGQNTPLYVAEQFPGQQDE
jgi:hypothetical protein